jgi:hypothetical protein
MEIREDLYDFVLETLIEEGNTKEESLLMMSTINENWLQGMQNAAKMFRMMTGIDKMPVKPPSGPANLTNIFRGASTPPTPKPAPFQIGTPKPKPVARGGGSPISAVVQALTNLQGDTPQTRSPQQIRDRDAAIQKRWGKEMNLNPSKFDMAGPDVVVPKPAGPDQGVGTKPRVAEPYTPPRPPAPKEPEKKVELQPVVTKKKVVAPVVKKPAPAKPVDPRLQKYRDLVKKGKRLEAETLGREIYQSTYGAPAFRPTKTA